MYLIPESQDLSDAVAFANKYSNHAGSRVDAQPTQKVPDSGEAEADVEDPGHDSSEEKNGKNPKLKDFILETRSNAEEE